MRKESRLESIEQATDLPLTILAIVLVPLLLLPWIFDLPDPVTASFEVADYMIWGVFAAVFVLKITVAPRRIAFIRENWLEAALVVLPMLRPLRAMRALRLTRIITAIGFNMDVSRRLFTDRSTRIVATATVVMLVVGAGLVLVAERDADDANITNFGEALWWAAVTVTTVGYGDRVPVTPAGRGIALALMLIGIAVVSTLTAAIAALIVRAHEREPVDLDDIMHELGEIRREIEALRTDESARAENPTNEQP